MAELSDFGMSGYLVQSEGLTLHVREGGARGPTVIFVHGYPDTHDVWLNMIARLSADFHCVRYDVRGAGRSDAPTNREGYRLHHLIGDLITVMDLVAADEPVHLVGHDWGSVQAWGAVVREASDPRLRGRIASYTTISGPCLEHFGAFLRSGRGADWRRRREVLIQLGRSWYVAAFQLPLLPELALRRIASSKRIQLATLGTSHFAASLPDDAVNGLNLYRANLVHREQVPGGPRTSVPVQVIIPTRDKYLTPAVYRDLHRFAPDLVRTEIDAGHWPQQTHPEQLAGLIAGFVRAKSSRR